MLLRALSLLMIVLLVAGCSGKQSQKVASLQRSDKNLSCKEVMLEMNEAEFYRKNAEKNKGPSISSLVMPLGYISTYMSAEDAIDASNGRVKYLNRIYEILDCDNPNAAANRIPARAASVAPEFGPQASYMPVAPGQQQFNATAPAYGRWY